MNLYASISDTVWHSEDQGESWGDIGRIVPGETIFTLAFHPQDTGLMYGITSGGIYLSENRALTWTPLFAPDTGRWTSGRLRFHPRDPDRIYLVTSRHLYESRNAGLSWVEFGSDFEGYPWYNDLIIDPFDPSTLHIATSWGSYRLSRDDDLASAVENSPPLPVVFELGQNSPNPFNAQTAISYQLPRAGEVELIIYNIAGQRVKELVARKQSAGRHQILWNGTDDAGRPVGSGVYFYRLSTDTWARTRRMLLLK